MNKNVKWATKSFKKFIQISVQFMFKSKTRTISASMSLVTEHMVNLSTF